MRARAASFSVAFLATCAFLLLFRTSAVGPAAATETTTPADQVAVIQADPEMAPYVETLMARSESVRQAIERLNDSIPILVRALPVSQEGERFTARASTGETRFQTRDGNLKAIEILVDVTALATEGRDRNLATHLVDDAILIVLAHELFGHAIPIALAGGFEGFCSDYPTPESPSCSLERENIVRSEMGVEARRNYTEGQLPGFF